MRLDLTPYRRSTIGFDRLFDMLETNARGAAAENYPPFNLERLAEDRYRITLAVAGFTRDEIEITAQQNLLLVAGKKDQAQDNAAFLHLGIANRSFERRFELADFVFVDDARLNDGLLVIDLVREVPEAMKPKSIAIKTGARSPPSTTRRPTRQRRRKPERRLMIGRPACEVRTPLSRRVIELRPAGSASPPPR